MATLEEKQKELKKLMEEAVDLGRNLHERLRGENWEETHAFLSALEDTLYLPENANFFENLSERSVNEGLVLLKGSVDELKEKAAKALN